MADIPRSRAPRADSGSDITLPDVTVTASPDQDFSGAVTGADDGNADQDFSGGVVGIAGGAGRVRPEADQLTIMTGGRRLVGWTAVRVQRGVEMLPSSFVVELSERYPRQASQAVVDPGSSCQVYLGSDLILTGYIDLYWPHEDANSHVVTIQGRSKTEDLVDCSLAQPTVPPWVVQTGTFGEAAKRVAQPFGIEVSLPDGDFPWGNQIQAFTIQPGETCGQLLEELSRAAQALMWDDANGNLVLSKVGTKRAATALVEGQNCELSETRLSMDQRYSVVQVMNSAPQTVPGQPMALAMLASQKDSDVPRYRPLLVIMDNMGPDWSWPQKRADWEVARRYGRSRLVEVEVTGWRAGDGQLWQPNTVVAVNLPSLKMNQDLVIAQCSWQRAERAGTTTLMTLMPSQGLVPEPFFPTPPIPGYNAGAGGSGAGGAGASRRRR